MKCPECGSEDLCPLGSKGRKSAVAVRDSLRRLADQLDAALSRS